MTDLPTVIHERFRRALAAALPDAPEAADADPVIRPSTNARFGDYQANAAMALAKRLGHKPRDLAQRIIDHLDSADLFENVEIAGPGFINLTLTAAAIEQHVHAMHQDQRLGVPHVESPRTVVVDYSGPNVAKEMHIGHLRSTIIGDAIARVLDFQGHDVKRRNHLGDWGTQFGMLIEHLSETFPREQLVTEDISIGDLNAFYQAAKVKFDADPAFAKRSRARVVKLQGGDADSVQLWQALRKESIEHFDTTYQRLDVLLADDDLAPESSYNDQLPNVIDELDRAGLLRESQGAQVVYPEGFADRDSEPMPMIVRKSDGGYLYATTDLAAARHRLSELHANRIIYVTDARQSQHFAMVFQTLRQAGWAGDAGEGGVRLDHVAFGSILGKDRRPFKTRAGGTVKLADVLDEAEQRAAAVITQKNPDLPTQQREAIAHVVGIGALKYADLSSDRVKDYIFDWQRMLALEGNTAPYLQNAYVRIRSIFRKAGEEAHGLQSVGVEPSGGVGSIQLGEPAERTLALHLLQLPATIAAVADSLEPHRLCNYLYELAAAYHRFYEQCPVLTAPDDATRQSRLRLSALTARTLKQGLDLLGIGVVERM